VTVEDWQRHVVDVIASQVRRYRHERGMSAQQLADTCTDLGLPIQRSVLANFENGRRPTISVPELLVFAAALDVPPVLLLLPLGQEQQAEILPGRASPTADALAWLIGEWSAEAGEDDWAAAQRYREAASTVAQFRLHRNLLQSWQESRIQGDWFRREAEEFRQGNNPDEADRYVKEAQREDESADEAWRRLRRLRTAMRGRTLDPPPLPPPLAIREKVEVES
jgi:transcriptional regulator with XRE-family HTH domain